MNPQFDGIKDAMAYVRQEAEGLPVFWGVGNPVYRDHVQVVHLPWKLSVSFQNGDKCSRYMLLELTNNK